MKLSRTVTYAVQAALQLASAASPGPGPVPCSRLAAEGKMPERFLLQILRSLVTHGILHSTRGVDGGYTLTRPANDISLLELIEAIEGPLNCETEFNQSLPRESQVSLQQALSKAADSMRDQLKAIKLSHLAVTRRKHDVHGEAGAN